MEKLSSPHCGNYNVDFPLGGKNRSKIIYVPQSAKEVKKKSVHNMETILTKLPQLNTECPAKLYTLLFL